MKVESLNLVDFTVCHNPRRPVPGLQDNFAKEGYENYTPMQFAHELGLSEDEEKRNKFVELVEKYESEPRGLVDLASSRRSEAIQPITVRVASRKGGHVHYALVAGERRYLAGVYNYAKHGDKPVIDAIVKNINLDESADLALDENLNRLDMTELEIAEAIRAKRQRINPDTGKRFTLREIARVWPYGGKELSARYQFIRGREALNYLSDKDKDRLCRGTLGVTKAVQMGFDLKKGKSVESPKDSDGSRRRSMNLTEIRALFDATDPKNTERLQTLAEVMKMTLAEAKEESKERKATAEAA